MNRHISRRMVIAGSLAVVACRPKSGPTSSTAPMDAHYRSFEKRVLPVAIQKGLGVLHMKPLGGGFILESKTATAGECLRRSVIILDKPTAHRGENNIR